jgi:hypothetical protein
MLTITDRTAARNCQGLSRRDFLRIGALGAGGLSLADLLAVRAAAAATGNTLRDTSVVLLFLQGGPSHIEFFDPKMSAPAEFRSITGEVRTALPGYTFGGTFPQLAQRADRIAVLRSYGSKNSGHTYDPVVTAGNPLKASASSIYTRFAGANHPRTGMPRNVLVLPEAVQPGLKLGNNFETGALPTLTQAGDLGSSFAAFNPVGGGELREAMQLRLSAERFHDRRSLLADLDQMRRRLDSSGAVEGSDQFQQQAFDVINNGIAEAFDLSHENPRTLERYDTSHLFRMADLQYWGDMRRTTNLLGRQLLLARRLCEAGCGFVTVSDCGWDMHANGNSPKGMAGIRPMGHQVDHAVSAFLDDVRERGLSDRILLVVTGEMGRTPRINKDGGRDHYGELTPLLIAGGGLKMGQVIGQSDGQAARSITTPYNPTHLVATILHTLFDAGKLRLEPGIPPAIAKLVEGEPIQELFG